MTQFKQNKSINDLRSSIARYHGFFEAVRDGILILDASNGMILDVNSFLIKLLGYSKENFLGKHVWDIGIFKDVFANIKKFNELINKKYVKYENLPLQNSKGKKIAVEFVSSVYLVDNKKIVQCNIRDITKRRKAEEQLKESELRYHSIFNSSRDGVLFLISDNGMIIDVNPFLINLLGYSRKSFLGKHVWELGLFKDIAANKSKFKKLMDKKYVKYDNLPLETSKGKKIQVEFISRVYMIGNKKIVQCNIRDITERKKAEEEISKELSINKSIIENTDSIIFSIDANYCYTHFNANHVKTMKNLYGADIKVGKSLFKYQPKRDAEFAKINIDRALKGERVIETNSSGIKPNEKFFEVIHNPIKNSKGKIIGVSIFAKDITEHKKTENKVLFDNLLLKSEFEASIDGILVVDENGKILVFNKRFVELWDIPESVIKTQSDKLALEYVTNKLVNPKEFIEKINYLYKHKDNKIRDEISLNDGRTFDRYSGPLISKDKKYYGRVWYFRDVTEGKKAEKLKIEIAAQKELENLRSNMLMMITHELKQPLTPIMGYAELIKEKMTTEEDKTYLNRIIISSQKMRDLINKILTLFKLEAGTLQLIFKKEDLSKIIKDAIIYKNPDFKIKKIKIVTKISEVNAEFDLERINDVIINLLDNAIKFSKEGGQIIISLVKEKNNAVLSVKDEGIGIRKDDLPKLFTKFYQTEEGKRFGGTGIGLALMKQIIGKHNGKIEVKSEFGKGTEFIITIPRLNK